MERKLVIIDYILPKNSYVGEKILTKSKNNKLMVYYLNKYNNGKLKTKRFQPKKAVIPKKIEINSILIECMGLYQGDGQKSIKSKSYQVTKFSNSNLNLILYFLNFLKMAFNLKLERLNAHIILGTALKNKISETKAINYWSKNTKIPLKNFYKVYWNKNKYLDSKSEPYGNLSLIYSNSSFRIVFDSIFKYTKNLALKNKEIAINFLRGLIAADGNVYYNPISKQREVNIAAKEEEDRRFIRKLFNLININPNKDNLTKNKETVRITGLTNLTLIHKYNLAGLHPNKDKKFKELINSYKNICYRKGEGIPHIERLLKEKSQTVYELSQQLNRKPNAIRRYLKLLELDKKVKKETGNQVNESGRIAEKWSLI